MYYIRQTLLSFLEEGLGTRLGTQCFAKHTKLIKPLTFTYDYSYDSTFSVVTTVTIQLPLLWLQNHFPLYCDYSYHSRVSLSAISSTEGTHLLSWFQEGSENVLTLVIFLGTKLHEEEDHYEGRIISGLWASTLTITYTNSRSIFYWSEHGA